jgi:hypothetical protein
MPACCLGTAKAALGAAAAAAAARGYTGAALASQAYQAQSGNKWPKLIPSAKHASVS